MRPENRFLTKNGYGDMVVMSIEAYERHQFESEVYLKLKEAELEAKLSGKRFSQKKFLMSCEQNFRAG